MTAEMTKLPLFNDLRVGALAENGRRRTQRKEGGDEIRFHLGQEGDGCKLEEKPAAILGRSQETS